jgi:competence protein ComEA
MNSTLKYFSFTKNEAKVILFIIAVLITGFSIKYVKHLSDLNKKSEFDYTKTEEMFKKLSRVSTNPGDNSSQNNLSGISNSENPLYNKLYAVEDSVKTKEKKKSKKEELLKPKSININTATKEILITLPGVGESTADKIIKYRESHNGFKKIEHIMKVKGIGKKKFDKLKDYIYIE